MDEFDEFEDWELEEVYEGSMDRQVYKLCLLGATNREIADFLHITESKFKSWVDKYPTLYKAMRKGKMEADSKVAEALYKRAIGYSHEEEKIFQYEGIPVVVPTRKHYPPDTTAALTWLRLRQREKWTEVKTDGGETGSFKLTVIMDD